MTHVLVSSNPLFAEILSHTFLGMVGASIVQITPQAAPQWIREERPQVIIVDESRVSVGELGDILEVVRSLPQSRTILFNLLNNNVTIVTAQQTTIGKTEDLVSVLGGVEAKP